MNSQAGRFKYPGGLPQAGATLLLCLLLLTVLALLALASASDSVLQGKMAANGERAVASAYAADSTLDWAENWILGLDGSERPAPCTGPCAPGSVIHAPEVFPPAPEYESEQWWLDNGFEDGLDPVSGIRLQQRAGQYAQAGLWIIEEVLFEPANPEADQRPDISYYRVIARGVAQAGITTSITESIIARPWGNAEWSDPFPANVDETSFCVRYLTAKPCGRLAWRQRR